MSKKICIIDDDKVYRFTVRFFLEDVIEDDDFIEYEDGEVALLELSSKLNSGDDLPEVIMVDINMPHLDGWEFLDKFYTRIQHLVKIPKLYLISSSNSRVDKERAEELSFLKGFLSKPLSKADYLRLIEA